MLRLPKSEVFTALVEAYPNAFNHEKGLKTVTEEWSKPGYDLSAENGTCKISHGTKSDLMRSLGQWITRRPDELSEEPEMKFRGLMIDNSRNAVMKPEKIKEIMLKLALFGYNALCLYTEDTYEVKEHPEIGYMRGKYTHSELEELDRYARELGIEMFPCIQTLGHLREILSHPNYAHLRDTENVLNLKTEETYSLLEKLIENAVAPYSSKRIHLGLDETRGLSTGRAFIPNEPIDPREAYLDHLNWLSDLCESMGLDPMMWGDIVIGMSGTQSFDQSQTERLPENMKMVFWTYRIHDQKYYRDTINKYREMGFNPLVAPGLWSWGRLWGSQSMADATAPRFMEVSRSKGVQEALMTMWGDDGHEAPFASNYPALGQFAEDCWHSQLVNQDTANLVQAICGTPLETYSLPSRLDHYPGRERESIESFANISKGILWDDPLLGIYARHYENDSLEAHFEKIGKDIEFSSTKASSDDGALFQYARDLSEVLRLKADLHNKARKAYLKGDTELLRSISEGIPGLVEAMTRLKDAHTEIWQEERKPFGLEVLQARYGGQLVRLRHMEKKLEGFLSGEISEIEQFEERTVNIWHSVASSRVRYGQVSTISTVR